MTKIITVLAAISVVILAAVVFIFLFNKPSIQSANIEPRNDGQANLSSTTNTEQPSVLSAESAKVSAISIETTYKDFYEENSKCRKTYNEYFGNEDGMHNSNSPCQFNMEFRRDTGYASRDITIRRWDKAAKQDRLIERSLWKGTISPEQFDQLAKAITENAAYKNWKDGVNATASNSKISVTTSGGTRTMMSNVDKSATTYLLMIKAFQEANKKIKWEGAQ